MRCNVCIHGAERRQHCLVRATTALLGVEDGPELTQQPVRGSGGLHLVELCLSLSEALLRLGGGLLGGLARLVQESHLLLLTAREQTTQRASFVVSHAHVLGEGFGQSFDGH